MGPILHLGDRIKVENVKHAKLEFVIFLSPDKILLVKGYLHIYSFFYLNFFSILGQVLCYYLNINLIFILYHFCIKPLPHLQLFEEYISRSAYCSSLYMQKKNRFLFTKVSIFISSELFRKTSTAFLSTMLLLTRCQTLCDYNLHPNQRGNISLLL